MAIPATMQYEFNTAGSNNNGGGFDSAAVGTGTDYSLATAANHTWLSAGGTHTNDLACTNATPSVMSSASHNFSTAEIGNIINITEGTSWTAGRYMIVSVASNNATLDRKANVSSTAGTAGSGYLGGALAIPTDAILETSVAGNTWWLKENGDGATIFTLTEALSIAAVGTSSARIRMCAYRTTRGETLIGTQRPKVVNAAYTLTFTTFWEIKNIIVVTQCALGIRIGADGRLVNCKAIGSGGVPAMSSITVRTWAINCEASSIAATANDGILFNYGCYYHDSTSGIVPLANSIIYNCVINNCLTAINIADIDYATIMHNTLYGSSTPTGTGIAGTTSNSNRIIGNIIDGFANGVNITTTYDDQFSDYNNYHNNTTDVTGLTLGANDIDADPAFVNASGQTGANLCTNGADWTGASAATPPTGWAQVTAGHFNIHSGSGQAGDYLIIDHNGTNNTPEISYEFDTAIGTNYKITFYCAKGDATSAIARVGTTSGGSQIYSFTFTDAGTDGAEAWALKSYVFTATATHTYFSIGATTSTSGRYVMFDTVTIYEHKPDFTPGASCQLTIDWTKMGL